MYGKVFAQIFESTINELALHVRFVFIALLVICDEEGVVDATPESIARRINVPVEQVVEAIDELSRPDSRSRSSEEEGRRLVAIRSTYGWRIVNYIKYREMKCQADRRTYMREYMRDRRAGKQPVNTGKPALAQLAQEEAVSRGRTRSKKAEVLEKEKEATAATRASEEPTEIWLRARVREIRNSDSLMAMAAHDPDAYEQEVRNLTGRSPEEVARLTGDAGVLPLRDQVPSRRRRSA